MPRTRSCDSRAFSELMGISFGTGEQAPDATFIEAPSSTKNAAGARDPKMHQGKKGKNRHFGLKAHFGFKTHIGVDAGSGLVHSAEVTSANASDISMARVLVREDDAFCYADSGYAGIAKRPEVVGDACLSRVDWISVSLDRRIQPWRLLLILVRRSSRTKNYRFGIKKHDWSRNEASFRAEWAQ